MKHNKSILCEFGLHKWENNLIGVEDLSPIGTFMYYTLNKKTCNNCKKEKIKNKITIISRKEYDNLLRKTIRKLKIEKLNDN